MTKSTELRKWLSPSVSYSLVLRDAEGESKHDFHLCFDFNALAAIEQHLGINLLAQFSHIFSISAISVSIFFWAAIQAYQPEYAGEEGLAAVRSYLNIANFEEAALKVQDAFKLSLNKEQLDRVEKALADAKSELEAERKSKKRKAGAAPLAESV